MGPSTESVSIALNVLAYTCLSSGQKAQTGRFVFIQNKSRAPFYYRASPSSQYISVVGRKTLWITSSNAFFYEIPPATSRIIDCSGYESQQEKTLSTEAVLQIKFCQSGNQPPSGQPSAIATGLVTPPEPTLTFAIDNSMESGREAYAFINYNCGRQNIYYVSDVFKYTIGKDPETLKKNLLRNYWELIKDHTNQKYGFDDLIGNTGNDCILYFEGGRVPLTRDDALEIRDGVTKPLERDGVRVHTVKVQQ